MRDAVIVGAGHNGLVAAAYLARAGLDVEVLERRDIVGGACVTEELWPGVWGSPGAYTLSLLRSEIIRDLELRAHGLEVHVHEPYLFAPFPEGRSVVIWSDANRTASQLEKGWSAEDARAYREWAERREVAAARARPLMLEPADRERWLEAVGLQLLEGSIADELAGIPSEQVRVPLALQGLIGCLVGPEDPGTSFISLFHDLGEAAGPPGAWGFARGGMGAVTRALRGAAEAAGARVRTEVEVESIDGLEADIVVSAADPLTSARLAGVDPPAGWRQVGPVVKVMCLLDGLPGFPAWPGEEPWRGSIDLGYSLDELSQAALGARAAGPPSAPGSRPPARPPRTRHWRRRASTSCRSSASAFRPTWTPRPPPTRRWRASPRSAPACPTASRGGSRWARSSSSSVSASRAGTSSTATCCRVSCSRSVCTRAPSVAGPT